MKKIIMIGFINCMLVGCNQTATIAPTATSEAITFPAKVNANDSTMSQSPIKPDALDQYLFLSDTICIDTRSVAQVNEEGSIAGFVNIPFYEYICSFQKSDTTLFYMKKPEGGKVGDVGSFVPLYEESEEIIQTMFQKKNTILVIATAGVESSYFINLLIQYGYDGAKCYNVGSFTTGMGSDIAYKSYANAKYYRPPLFLENVVTPFSTANLTRLEDNQ